MKLALLLCLAGCEARFVDRHPPPAMVDFSSPADADEPRDLGVDLE